MQANTPVSRLGDKSDHGGEIITATTKLHISGVPLARTGDIHRCPEHGDTPITARSTMCYDNLAVAHVGAVAGCGAVITTGVDTLLTHLKEV
jgi:uncharacterized Zn-binding protein involved in type VI secretion